jgi:hypothetical protein
VAVATAELPVGEAACLDDGQITVLDLIPLGHKVAVAPIAAGEKVYKYGCPIGTATRPIRVGQHVHVHNLKSDYFPTFIRAELIESRVASAARATNGSPVSPEKWMEVSNNRHGKQ